MSIRPKLRKTLGCYTYFFKLQWRLSKLSLFLIIASHLMNTVNSLVIVLFPGYILSSIEQNLHRQFILAVIAFAVWEFAIAILKAAMERSAKIQSEKVKSGINQMLVEKAASLRQEQLEHPEVFERLELARTCARQDAVRGFLNNLFSIVFLVVELAGLLYVLKDMPVIGVVLFVGGTAVYVIANRIIAKKSVEEEEEENQPNRIMRYFSYEIPKPAYAKEIRVFGFQPFVSRRHAETLEESIGVTRKYLHQLSNAQQYTKITEGVLSVFFYTYNILRFAAGKLTVGAFTVTMSAIFRFSRVVSSIVSKSVDCSAQSVRLAKVKDFLEMPNLYTGKKDVAPFDNNGSIEFVHVSYRYPGSETYALRDINFSFRFGEKLSVVGTNGAGKTTFIALMTGLYKPTEGRILYNGTDIEELDSGQYQKLFSVLLQDYQIYAFSVLDNILLTDRPSEQETAAAQNRIDQIGLRGAVDKLPKKADTYMTQRFDQGGVELSGGEGQKLAIARALYRNAPVCILDEPTASLSPQNEYDIYRRFSEITKNRSVIFISHRLASCRLCSRIVVFDKGRIVEEGSHETLMGNKAMYAEMFTKQAELYV